MVGSVEPNHLEGKGLHPIIGRIPEGDGQIDLHKWHGLFSWHDAVERSLYGGAPLVSQHSRSQALV